MARTAYSRNAYDGGATQASLSASLDTTTTTVVLANTNSTWNSLGPSYGFFMSLGYGTQSEEKVYVPAQSVVWTNTTVTLTNVVRGVDGTAAAGHDAAAPVVVVMTATDLDEANYAVTQTVGKVTAQGDILYGSGANALAALVAGANNSVLSSNGSNAAPSWKTVASILPAISDLFIATATTGATQATVSVSGFTKYVVVAWRSITGGTGSYGANIDFGATTNQNGVTMTFAAAAQSGSLVTFYAVEGVSTAATTVNLNSSGATPTSSSNRLFVIGLSA